MHPSSDRYERAQGKTKPAAPESTAAERWMERIDMDALDLTIEPTEKRLSPAETKVFDA